MSDARALYKEGLQHLANDRLEEAVACYRRATEVDPELPLAWNGLSMALKQSGDLDGAIAAARKLAELDPDDPLSHTNLSVLYQSAGMIQEAEDEKALAMQLEMKARR